MNKLLATLTLLLHTWACSAAPPSDESLRQLMVLTKAEAMVEVVHAQMVPLLQQMMRRTVGAETLTPERSQVLERSIERMTALMRREISWARLEPLQIAIYRESFDQTEIDALIAFYQTPTGQIVINKMPVVAQKSIMVMQGYMQESTPRLQAAMQEILTDEKLLPPR